MDLAARNVFVDEWMNIKIGDFGASRLVTSTNVQMDETSPDTQTSTKVGGKRFAIKWMALESLLNGVFSTQSDVWSFGVLMWELFTMGAIPYVDVELLNMLMFLSAGNRLKCPKYANNQIFGLMAACWHCQPRSRPSFETLRERIGRLLDSVTQDYGYVDVLQQEEDV